MVGRKQQVSMIMSETRAATGACNAIPVSQCTVPPSPAFVQFGAMLMQPSNLQSTGTRRINKASAAIKREQERKLTVKQQALEATQYDAEAARREHERELKVKHQALEAASRKHEKEVAVNQQALKASECEVEAARCEHERELKVNHQVLEAARCGEISGFWGPIGRFD